MNVSDQGMQNNLAINNYPTENINIERPINIESSINVSNSQNTGTTQENDKKEIKEINNAIRKLNTFLEDHKTHAEVSVHNKLNTIMVKIVDDNTKQVIMELPSEKILDMVAKFCEMVGILVDKKA